jgi:UDP-N-acetylmuramyl pentapeptide synthase
MKIMYPKMLRADLTLGLLAKFSVQNYLFASLLSKNSNIKIQKTAISPPYFT